MIQASGPITTSDNDRQFLPITSPVAGRRIGLEKLKSFVMQTASTCIHEPEGMFKRRYVTPTCGIVPGSDDNSDVTERCRIGHYLQVYDWDACFFSEAESYLGLTDLAHDVVLNFLGLKHADGFIPRCVSPYRIWEGSDLCKPFLCQALLKEIVSGYSTRQLTAQTVQELEQYLNYFENHRRHMSGLYHWRNVLESGVDDNIALLFPVDASKDDNELVIHGYPDGHLIAADLSGYLVAEYRALSELANKVGLKASADLHLERSREIQQQIEDVLWNEDMGSYCNYDPLSYQHVASQSWTNLVPVFLGIASPARAQRVIEQLILNPEHYLRPAGLSSVACSDGLYNQAKRGLYGRATVSNWQGPCWVLPNILAVRGLLKYGYTEQAEELALRILTTLQASVEKTGVMYENFNSETGEPLWAPNFMSWNVLSLELLELVS